MTFAELLRAARHAAGLTQEQLARRAHVSPFAIASWETGRRTPQDRGQVIDLADALGQDTASLNQWMRVLGLDPVPEERVLPLADRRVGLEAMRRDIQAYPWPCLVMDWNFEVLGWNRAANDLSELDFGTDLSEPGARGLLRMALSDSYFEKLQNWDEVIGQMVGMWKSDQQRIDEPESGALFFSRMMEYVFEHHSDKIGRLVNLWQQPAPSREGTRGVAPITWRTSTGVDLRLTALQSSWDDFDGSWAFDWMPADGATWRWLREQSEQGAWTDPLGYATGSEPTSWPAMLRVERERAGLSRRGLAQRSGIQQSTLYAYETGRRRPARETVLDLSRALELEGPTMNGILEAMGYDPEPSDWARVLIGQELRFTPRRAAKVTRDRAHTAAEVHDVIDVQPWPTIMVNGRCDMAAVNPAGRRLVGVDLESAVDPLARNLVSVVTSEPFRERIRNWEEVAARVIPRALEPYVTTAPGRDGYFDAVVDYVRRRDGHARNLAALFDAWRTNREARPSARMVFDVDWRADDADLRFHTIIAPWNPFDPYWAVDLHPADEGTWAWFGR